MSETTYAADWDESQYEIFEPGLLIVTYLADDLISVYRSADLSEDSDLYQPVFALTKGAEILGHVAHMKDSRMVGGVAEATVYKFP